VHPVSPAAHDYRLSTEPESVHDMTVLSAQPLATSSLATGLPAPDQVTP
jgi:hypothetical protein